MWSNVNFPPNGKTCSKLPIFIVGRTDGWSCENSSTDLSHNPPGNEICTYSRRKMIPAKFGYFETYRNGSIKRQNVLPQPAEPPMINTSAGDDNTRVWNPGCGSMYVFSGFDPIFKTKIANPGNTYEPRVATFTTPPVAWFIFGKQCANQTSFDPKLSW